MNRLVSAKARVTSGRRVGRGQVTELTSEGGIGLVPRKAANELRFRHPGAADPLVGQGPPRGGHQR